MRSAFDVPTQLTPGRTALFLDFDGTLAGIADHPDAVRVNPGVIDNLAALLAMLDGAIAVVSGREIAVIDRFMAPCRLVVSGVHGFEVRTANAEVTRLDANGDSLRQLDERLSRFAAPHPGLLLERKPGSLALHYRGSPELAQACREAVAGATRDLAGLVVMSGKMVIEVKAHAGDKGRAITELMASPPFRGRTPVFLGDDVTDEAGFEVVNREEGISIKVGPGQTCARFRLPDTRAVADWLGSLRTRFEDAIARGDEAT